MRTVDSAKGILSMALFEFPPEVCNFGDCIGNSDIIQAEDGSTQIVVHGISHASLMKRKLSRAKDMGKASPVDLPSDKPQDSQLR
jgi:hypothetical protein